jgi:hypothetical protein
MAEYQPSESTNGVEFLGININVDGVAISTNIIDILALIWNQPMSAASRAASIDLAIRTTNADAS